MTLYQTALVELDGVFERLDDAEVERLLDAIIAANRIVVFGGGRERLQIMGFAMRLYHMGLNVAVGHLDFCLFSAPFLCVAGLKRTGCR